MIITIFFSAQADLQKGFFAAETPEWHEAGAQQSQVPASGSLEAASSLGKWEAPGSSNAGNGEPCIALHVLQVTLQHDTEQQEQPYGYC